MSIWLEEVGILKVDCVIVSVVFQSQTDFKKDSKIKTHTTGYKTKVILNTYGTALVWVLTCHLFRHQKHSLNFTVNLTT